MSDVVVTVPKNFTMDYDGLRPGLEQWLGEGDAPGQTWTGQEWDFTACGSRPNIATGERVYVVCNGRLVGYAPLIRLGINGRYISFIRGGGAVAVTIPQPIVGFRGWRYRWWERSVETPLDLSEFIHDAMK